MKTTAMLMTLVALAAAGCGKDESNGRDPSAADGSADAASGDPSATSKDKKPTAKRGKDGTETLALAEGYAKAVCECKDARCINTAGDNYHEATNKLYEDGQARNATPEQKKQMDAASARVSECTKKLLKR